MALIFNNFSAKSFSNVFINDVFFGYMGAKIGKEVEFSKN
jgi:hypothetical protein